MITTLLALLLWSVPSTQQVHHGDRQFVDSKIMRGMQTKKVNPTYPPIARAAHISGVVVLRAIIGKDGHVHNLMAISGPEILRGASVEAVQQWEYKPYMMNGVPVEVDTTITVSFDIGSPNFKNIKPRNGPKGYKKLDENILRDLCQISSLVTSHISDDISGPQDVAVQLSLGADGNIETAHAVAGPEVLRLDAENRASHAQCHAWQDKHGEAKGSYGILIIRYRPQF